MVKAEEFKGIEYVRISTLPQDQADQIRSNRKVKRITILKDETYMRDCITYNDYRSWYENYYEPSGAVITAVTPEKVNSHSAKKSFSWNILRYFDVLVEKTN